MSRNQEYRRLALTALLVLTFTACGTRVERRASDSGPRPGLGATSEPDGASGVDAAPVAPDASVSLDSESAASVGNPGAPAARTTGPTTVPGTSPTGRTVTGGGTAAAPSRGAGPAISGGGAKQGPASGARGTGAPIPPVPEKPSGTSPAMIASVGTQSGPLGLIFGPAVAALQAWVKHINGKGGLNGHPVKLLVYDDGSDPARHRAQVQEAIEKEHVIAFVQNNEPFSGGSSVEYITSKRVPVIGSDTGSIWFYDSPMYFPQQTSALLVAQMGILAVGQQMVPAGKTKLGTLVCVEAHSCDAQEAEFAKTARRAGLEHVYRGRASLAQPDFTAECLSARSAGVQVFFMGLDANSIGRVGTACARQGFQPIFATIGLLVADRLKDDPNMASMVAGVGVFPYFQSGTPATDEFQQVMKAHGAGIPRGVAAASGWVSAKLFEKAGANLPEPPTSAAVLRGLWSLRDETLGGLTAPLTFSEGQTAKEVVCWFNITIKKQTWVSPDAYKLHCAEPAPS